MPKGMGGSRNGDEIWAVDVQRTAEEIAKRENESFLNQRSHCNEQRKYAQK
jgi:hypothetical protein